LCKNIATDSVSHELARNDAGSGKPIGVGPVVLLVNKSLSSLIAPHNDVMEPPGGKQLSSASHEKIVEYRSKSDLVGFFKCEMGMVGRLEFFLCQWHECCSKLFILIPLFKKGTTMLQQSRSLIPYRSLLALVALMGCAAPENIKTPRYTEPNWTVENPLATTGASEGSSRMASGTLASSLDALRKGESTATPASSPLKDIHFEFDRYDLQADARDILDANAKWLKEYPSMRVEIEGHCDERGTNEYNMGLGAKRAQTAKEYLVSLGIAAHRLSTVSYGEEIPVCTEHTISCWEKNRRDRFVIASAVPPS
jgi:peptidoglycan-associated lipoprotein